MNENEDTLEVKDLAVAAYLYCLDTVKFAGTKKTPSGIVLFLFSPKNDVLRSIEAYWNSTAKDVQPKRLFSAQRDLKDMIFGGKNGTN